MEFLIYQPLTIQKGSNLHLALTFFQVVENECSKIEAPPLFIFITDGKPGASYECEVASVLCIKCTARRGNATDPDNWADFVFQVNFSKDASCAIVNP